MRAARFQRFLLCLAAWFVGGSGAEAEAGEAGRPFLQNFSPRDYGARSQNWAATQDRQGIMYFGNQGVVLQYDGVSWRKIPINQVTDVVRGLDADPATGTVFVGGLNELGYLAAGADGEMRFVSLLDRLPAGDRDFRSVHRVFATPEGVFFAAEKQLMRWRDGAFRVWKLPAARLVRWQWVQGHLYAQEPSIGLLRLDGDEFVPVSADPLLRKIIVMTMVPDADGAVTLGTLRDGLFTLRGDQVTPLGVELNDFFKSKEIRRSLRLSDGSLAVATGSAGVILLDAAGRFLDRWDQASGLQNESDLDLFQDREGGVWLCLSAGLSRVEAHSPLSVFDRGNGFKPSLVHSLYRFKGTLYVNSGAGLYRIVEADPTKGLTAHAEPVPGLEGDCWSACAFGDDLLVADTMGVLRIDAGGHVARIYNGGFSGATLLRSRVQPERVFMGRRSELRTLRHDPAQDRWIDEGPVPGLEAETHSMEQTPDGDVWLGTNDRGVWRVHFAPDPDGVTRGAATATAFAGQAGPLGQQTWTRVAQRPDGALLIASKGGLFRRDATGTNFETATEYGAKFAGGAFRFDDIAPDLRGNVWFNARPADGLWLEQELGRADAKQPSNATAERQALSHRIVSQVSVVDCVYFDDHFFWMAGPGGLVRLDINAWERESGSPGFATLIRQADASDRSAADDGSPLTSASKLPYARNSVRFTLAANTFAVGAGLRYQTRLSGFGRGGWSAFGQRPEVAYTNLPEGFYRFEARARNSDGAVGTLAALNFQVLPPWERTPVAYLGYLVAAGAVVAGIVRWRGRALRVVNVRLEGLVEARTAELRAHEGDLVRAKEVAIGANRAKSVFLANMSHELRTPLNAILGYANILLKDATLTQRNRERLDVMRQSGSHLLTMINEVLDLSKIEAGKLTLQATDFSLADLIAEVSGAFRQRAAEKGLELRVVPGPEHPVYVHTDAGKLRQVLFNLLGNAIKFTERGNVTLRLTKGESGKMRFEVSDTGMGISLEEQQSIFLAFHQSVRTQGNVQGTGLGLAISQRLVELLGGRVELESRPGQGSRFWFDLALPEVETGAHPATDFLARKVIGIEGGKRRLLVVDDEPVNRQILSDLLTPLGFEIDEAEDGMQCLERCARTAFDALLLDLRLPRLSGLEVARTLRGGARNTGGKNAGVKIIAVSASVFESDRQEALDAGCDDFVPKPFQEAQLFAALGRALDVEWIFAAETVPATTTLPAPGSTAVPQPAEDRETIEALLEFSRRGDILGLRRHLQTLLVAGPTEASAAYLRRLEPLVAAYQMNRIRDVLLELKKPAD